MNDSFDNERTDKEMAERLSNPTWDEMDEAQRAEFDKGEAEYSGLFVPTPEEVLIADPDHVETCILEDGRCDVAYHTHHYYLSRAEMRRERMARKAKQHETYKAAVIKNAKYSWQEAQARADQLERIYEDLLKQGRIGR